MDSSTLERVIADAVAHKRIVKWGYVRQPGGLYPSECDSIAAHSNAVAALAVILAFEHADALKAHADVDLCIEAVSIMATFHDFGEGRSGDTGASSYATHGKCDLFNLEREGLQASLADTKCESKILKYFDDYRAYGTPEAIIVHIADNLEGFEKAIHSSQGGFPKILDDALRIFSQNVRIYRSKKEISSSLGKAADYMVDNVLIPGNKLILDTYGLNIDLSKYTQSS